MFSTGPKSLAGKLVSSANALKHGLFAKHTLITTGDGREDEAEFNALMEAYFTELKPVGRIESDLVEKMVVCEWRQARALKYERGQIRLRADSLLWREKNRAADYVATLRDRLIRATLLPEINETDLPDHAELEDLQREMKEAESTEQFDRLLEYWKSLRKLTKTTLDGLHELETAEAMRKLRKTSEGLESSIKTLQSMRTEVEQTGYLSQSSLLDAKVEFADFPAIVLVLTCFSEVAKKHADEKGRDKEITQTCLLNFISFEIKLLQQELNAAISAEDLMRDARLESVTLPPPQVSQTVARVIATIERTYYRAWDQLERLQRQRKGEQVPAPLKVSLN